MELSIAGEGSGSEKSESRALLMMISWGMEERYGVE
jgi:hypothetical protein